MLHGLHALVHSGSTRKAEKLGTFRDFCPICRGLQNFQATSYYSESHTRLFLLIRIPGDRSGATVVVSCQECGSGWRDEKACLRTLRPRQDAEVRCADRIALEERLRAGTITPEERSWLLLEPFRYLSSMLSVERALGGNDRLTTWGCLGTALVGLGGAVMVALLGRKHEETLTALGAVWLVLGAVAGGGMVYAWATRWRRFVRRELYPRLTRSLKPLLPTKHDLVATVKEFRGSDPEGKRFDGAALHDHMRGVVR